MSDTITAVVLNIKWEGNDRITLERREWCDIHDSPTYVGDCERHCDYGEVVHEAGGYEDCMFGVRLVEVPDDE